MLWRSFFIPFTPISWSCSFSSFIISLNSNNYSNVSYLGLLYVRSESSHLTVPLTHSPPITFQFFGLHPFTVLCTLIFLSATLICSAPHTQTSQLLCVTPGPHSAACYSRPMTIALGSYLPGLPHTTLCSGQTASSAAPKHTLPLSLGTSFLRPTRLSESSSSALYSLIGLQQGRARETGGLQRRAGQSTRSFTARGKAAEVSGWKS